MGPSQIQLFSNCCPLMTSHSSQCFIITQPITILNLIFKVVCWFCCFFLQFTHKCHWCSKTFGLAVFFGTSVVTGLHDHHCIWSVIQKLKNILGSRKKGAQEPHAAREQRYDYQGNAPSNLKGISLESLTLPAGLTSYCTVPLFLYLCGFPSDLFEHVRLCVCSALCLSAESSVLMQDESRSMGDAVIDMGSQGNPLQLQLIDEQVFVY